MSKTKQIIRLDASALKESSCLLRTYYTVIKGYTGSIPTIDIVYGLAFHQFMQTMKLTGGDFAPATQDAMKAFRIPSIMKAKKQWMTETHLLQTCFNYWNEVAVSDSWETVKIESRPLVELKFAIPYYQDEDFEVILCGTIDDIAKMKNGAYAIRDYKTTSVWDIKGYFEGYRLSPQLMFYIFILKLYAQLYPDSIINKIVNSGTPGAMIEGVFLKGEKVATFEKSEVFFFKDEQMAEFKLLLDLKIQEILGHLRTNTVPPRYGLLNGACATIYGACKFANACGSPDAIAREHVLRNNFITKEYNPLKFNE